MIIELSLFSIFLLAAVEASSEYATLRAIRTGDASKDSKYVNAYEVSVDERKSVERMRVSGQHSDAVVYAPLCEQNEEGGGDGNREFTFNDEKLTDPSRSSSYRFSVKYNCTQQSDGTSLRAAGELGLRTRDSPLWKVWTYATYASDEIRLGRTHPRNQDYKKWALGNNRGGKSDMIIPCLQSFDENLCEFNATVRGVPYMVDFKLDDSHIYLPHSLYMKFTSPSWAKKIKSRKKVASVEDWPAIFIHPVLPNASGRGSEPSVNTIKLDARLFVPTSFEQKRTPPSSSDEWVDFVAELLQDSPVAVASDSETHIMLGTRVLERYTLQRDYIGSRMRAMHTPVVDHFTLRQTLFLIVVMVIYVGHKASTMEYISVLLLGKWPRCHVCGKEVTFEICKRHITIGSRIVQRGREIALFSIAWVELAIDARLNSADSLSSAFELGVWGYLLLSLASALFVATNIIELWCDKSWGVYSVRRLFIAKCSAFESAAAVAMVSIASVVRGGDDFVTGLLSFVAAIVIYDSMRRLLIAVISLIHFAPKGKASTASNVFWLLYLLIGTLTVGSAYTGYIMTRHIVWPAFECGWLFTLVTLGACLFFALSVVSAYVRIEMRDILKRLDEERDK